MRLREADCAAAPQSEQITQLRLDRLSELELCSGHTKYALILKVIPRRNIKMLFWNGRATHIPFLPLFLCFPIRNTHFATDKKDVHVQRE